MEHLGIKIEVEGLWSEDRQSKFEDSIMQHSHLIHMFLSVLCRDFEEIVLFTTFSRSELPSHILACLLRCHFQHKIVKI